MSEPVARELTLAEKLAVPKETLAQVLQMIPEDNPLYGPLKRLAQELDAVGL